MQRSVTARGRLLGTRAAGAGTAARHPAAAEAVDLGASDSAGRMVGRAERARRVPHEGLSMADHHLAKRTWEIRPVSNGDADDARESFTRLDHPTAARLMMCGSPSESA